LLARANPDVIVLVGGIDGGATTALYEMANLIGVIAASRDQMARPVVIFAGNRQARPEIAARLGEIVSLRVVDNVHPARDRMLTALAGPVSNIMHSPRISIQ
jgi:hypothetical protein